MKTSQIGITRRLRISAILLILGLAVEALSLVWNRPLAFLLFIGIGGLFTLLGILGYLYSLVSATVFTAQDD